MWLTMISPHVVVCLLVTAIHFSSATTPAPGVNSSQPSTSLRYEAPDDCQWWIRESGGTFINGQEVALVCNLRTINSEFDSSNFSVIPSEHTTSLKIECSSDLMLRSSLNDKSFAHLSRLRELILEYCKMDQWPEGTLTGLRDLRNLTVRTHNTDWPSMRLVLSSDSFLQVKQLERLDLSTNNIWQFAPDLLCSLTNLIALNVSHNQLTEIGSINEPKEGIHCNLNIRILDASHNLFTLVSPIALESFPHLQELRLHNNQLETISDKAFGSLKNLKFVDLSSNILKKLPSDLFAECSESIKEIYLQNNSLSALPSHLFANLSQLLSLDLSSNHLNNECITNETFSGLIRLVSLNLARNQITKLNSTLFQDLYTLQILNLENNGLETVPADTFIALNNLHTLVLSNNRLKKLDARALNGLDALSLLSLDYNQLESIHPNAFRNCTSLQDLNISANKIAELPAALNEMPLLKTLDLGENLISNLEKPGFKGMTNLYGLRLIANQIEFVGKKSFVELPSLQILNLSQNQIKKIEKGTFASNLKLEAIRVDSNLLTSVDDVFNDVKSLVWLNISENKLKNFDYGSFPPNLLWLDVHGNFIENLNNKKQVQSVIQTLDVSFNKLTHVAPASLPDSIELLFLNDNLINHIEPHTFTTKVNLTRVDLYANNIVNLELSALQLSAVPPDRARPEFYIGGNPFKCDCFMEWLQRINRLEVRQHPLIMDIESIYCKLVYDREQDFVPLVKAAPSQFLCSYQTHCYTLCQCCPFDACDCEMNCPTNCNCYHDSTWSANIVDCSRANYTEMPLKSPMDATELYLDGNNFGELSSYSFIGRKNLRHLYVNNSNVGMIYNFTFSGIGKLISLHLENNQIRSLEGYEFSSLENLKELYLQNNKIAKIDSRTFVKLKNLEILHLNNNKLVKFEVWQFVANPYLVNVAVSGNPWSCDCQFVSELRMWIQENFAKITDIDHISCQSRNETSSLSNFLKSPNNTVSCLTLFGSLAENQILRDYLPFLLLTTTIFVVIVIVTMIIIVYKKELHGCLYTHCGLHSCYKSTAFSDDGDHEKLFDAYIAYCIKDEDFITRILCPTLEQCDTPYRLCLHYRDLNINSYIGDTIVQAAESSKRTLIVLSKNFLQTEWCRFEYKSALREVLRDRRNKVMFVLLGEIPAHDLDPDLRLYMKVSTCMQWGDSLFWQKLKYFMPDVKESAPTFVISSGNSANVYATPFNYYDNSADRHPNSNFPPIPSPPPLSTLKKAYNQYSHSLLSNGSGGMEKNVNLPSLWT